MDPTPHGADMAAGIALQFVLIVAPVFFTMRYFRRELPRMQRQAAAFDAHYTAAERADSVSRAGQRATERAEGTYRLRADGQTVFAVVGIPSLRPVTRGAHTFISPVVGVVLGVQLGAIPLALIALTIMWYLARRRDDHHGVARLA